MMREKANDYTSATVSVWIIYELATRPEYMDALRDELYTCATADAISGDLRISYNALQEASLLDSFIREVLRTKGDTLSVCRKTTADVLLAGKVVPKGEDHFDGLFMSFLLAST